MNLRILLTGGTFDKRYDPVTGALGFGAEGEEGESGSCVPGIVERARAAAGVQIQTVMMIDSLDMVDVHRQRILDAARTAPEPALVIVHGTDTMVETAAVLAHAALPKTIVLTGAMVPFAVEDSDASFNLGAAMAYARALDPGVWVAMNAIARPWNDVRKNRELGVFEGMSQAGPERAG